MTYPLPPHHQSELVLALEIDLVLEIELALVIDIGHYRINASICLLTCPPHHISQSFDLPTATTSLVKASASARDIASASTRQRITISPHQSFDIGPCHHISRSFDLPTATTSVSHLTCPLPLNHCNITSVSHLTCPHHHISQSFDLPTSTTSCMSPPPLALALAQALALVLGS